MLSGPQADAPGFPVQHLRKDVVAPAAFPVRRRTAGGRADKSSIERVMASPAPYFRNLIFIVRSIRGRGHETSFQRGRMRKPAFGARNPNPGRFRASSRTAIGPFCKVLAGLGQGDEARVPGNPARSRGDLSGSPEVPRWSAGRRVCLSSEKTHHAARRELMVALLSAPSPRALVRRERKEGAPGA